MRNLLAVISGAVVGTITLLMVGVIANAISPTPPELMDPSTPEAVEMRVASASIGTWLSTILGLALGAFLGGIVAVLIARVRSIWVAGAVGLLLSLWAFYTFYVVYPAVLWVPLAMLVSAFFFSVLGGQLVMRSQHSE